jgi:hypothetical protein
MALLNQRWCRWARGGLLGALLGWGLAACGTQGGGEPLVDAWPRTALRSFVLRDAEQPYALLRLGWDLDQPAVAPRLDEAAGPLPIWGRMSPRQEAQHGVLFRATVTDLGAAAPPELALEPAVGWEGSGLSSPTWLAAEAGRPPLLFYQGSDGSVGLARLGEDGQVQRLTPAAPLLPAAALGTGRIGRLSVVSVGATVRLYYLVDDQRAHFAQLDAAALARRAAADSGALDFQVSAPLLWASDFTVKQTAVVMVPAERLAGLWVRRVITPAGRDRFDLYAVASAMTKSVVVSASSYSGGVIGSTSERFLPVESPALASNDQGTPSSPAMILYQGQPLMLLGLRTVQTGIAAAVPP